MKLSVLIFCLFLFVSCQQEEQGKSSTATTVSMGTTTSGQAAVSAANDDFSDLKKKDDEGCEDKTAEDIEKELEKKMAEMKKAQEQGKPTGFNFNSGEPGCDPNAEEPKKEH